MPFTKRIIAGSTLITLLPILFGAMLYHRLPDRMPTHFAADGSVTETMPKLVVVFGLPLFFAIINVIVLVFTNADPKNKHLTTFPVAIIASLIPFITVGTMLMVDVLALGYRVQITTVVMFILGIVFIAIGLVLPKVDTSYTIGIRTPWTLSNRNNWRMVHRLGGRLFIGAGILLFGCAGFNHTPIFLTILVIIILIVVIVPIVYSYLLWRQSNR